MPNGRIFTETEKLWVYFATECAYSRLSQNLSGLSIFPVYIVKSRLAPRQVVFEFVSSHRGAHITLLGTTTHEADRRETKNKTASSIISGYDKLGGKKELISY